MSRSCSFYVYLTEDTSGQLMFVGYVKLLPSPEILATQIIPKLGSALGLRDVPRPRHTSSHTKPTLVKYFSIQEFLSRTFEI